MLVRAVLSVSQSMGPHGLGYNSSSLWKMSHLLSPKDIPILLSLHANNVRRTGVKFALASQCKAGLDGVLEAVEKKTFSFSDAEDTLHLIVGFNQCDSQTRQLAQEANQKLKLIREEEYKKVMRESERRKSEKKRTDDERIQANAIMSLTTEAKSSLTKEEREEVFKRSIRAAGLDGPRTPEQEEFVRRMYNGMVLQQPSFSNQSQGK